jgi:hypothetical protein
MTMQSKRSLAVALVLLLTLLTGGAALASSA